MADEADNLRNLSQQDHVDSDLVDKNVLAAKALSIMNDKKITSLCVYDKKNKSKTIGIVHIHNILKFNI